MKNKMNKRNWANLHEVQGTPLEAKQMVELYWNKYFRI